MTDANASAEDGQAIEQSTGPARSLSVGDDCPNCGREITETASAGLLAYCWWCNDRTADHLVADGGVENHLGEAPDFEFDKGQSFKLAGVEDPEEYWYVLARVWNYDADTDDALVQIRAYKQYLVGEVSTLGGDERLVTEGDLIQHYEPVDKETASEVLHS